MTKTTKNSTTYEIKDKNLFFCPFYILRRKQDQEEKKAYFFEGDLVS